MNKKAMMDDFFDFLFTVFIAFFSLIFIGFILNSGVDSSNTFSMSRMIDAGTTGAAISKLRYQQYIGFGLDKEDFDREVANIKIVEIKKDYGCKDYDTKDYCEDDPAYLADWGHQCFWSQQNMQCYQLKMSNAEHTAVNQALYDYK
jgi:hypothetical protein